jgi:hypothetical protein
LKFLPHPDLIFHVIKIFLPHPVPIFHVKNEKILPISVGCLSLEKLNWDSQQGRDLATSGRNKKKIQSGQSYSYIMWKVWCHQI